MSINHIREKHVIRIIIIRRSASCPEIRFTNRLIEETVSVPAAHGVRATPTNSYDCRFMSLIGLEVKNRRKSSVEICVNDVRLLAAGSAELLNHVRAELATCVTDRLDARRTRTRRLHAAKLARLRNRSR